MSRTKNAEAAEAVESAEPKPKTSAQRAREFLESKSASEWDEVLGKTKGYHYYIVDLAMKPGRIQRMQSELRRRGYDRCKDVGDSAYSTEIKLAEVWRIDDEGHRVLAQARQAHDDAERARNKILP